MKEKLLLIVNELLEEAGQDQVDKFEVSMSLRDELNMDSLMLAELTVRIEDEYGVDIFENGIVQTVGEIVLKLEGKL